MVAACPFPYGRGTPIRIFRMAEALSDRGHHVNVIAYHLGNSINNLPFKIHRILNVRTYKKYSPGPNYQKLIVLDSLLTLKLLKYLKENRTDIIHAHNYEGLLISLIIRTRINIPVIYDAHTLLESELPYYKLGLSNKIKKMFGQLIDRWAPKKADHIIAVTDRIKSKLILDSDINPDRVTTIMNGVKENHFSPSSDNQKDKIFSREKILIFTGNLASYQRIDLLLRLFQLVLLQRGDVRLLIVTDSSFDSYEQMAKELNIRKNIDIYNSDFNTLPEYLAAADVALNPRIDCDGLPQKLLNYMAAGKPIVTFQSSGKILTDGVTGLVIEDGNLQAFADAILILLNNPILGNTLGANAREIVKAKYNWMNIAGELEDVYEKVLTAKSKLTALANNSLILKA